MTDLYVFSKPGDVSKSIITLNVHPSFSLNPPGSTTAEPFAPGALYEIQFDTNGDAVADLNYRVQFSSSEDGTQTATVRRIHGARAAGFGEEGEEIVKDAPVSVGREALVTRAGDYRFFFGWRSDPFFFDTNGLFNNMQFTGDDFFTDKDVCSIVLELPNSAFGSKEVGLWARTVDKTKVGHRPTAVGDRYRRFFWRGTQGRRTSAASQRMMVALLRFSRTNWNTQAAVMRRETQSRSRESCCQTFFPMTLVARYPFRTMDGHSPTMLSTFFSFYSRTGR